LRRTDRAAAGIARVRQHEGARAGDTYLAAYFDRYPDQGTYYGVPGRHHDQLPDNSLTALRAWETREDESLTEARGIDPATIEEGSLRATYAIVREALEGSVGARVCRSALWNVSHIRAFHDRVLEDGAVPISFLSAKIRSWVQSAAGS
jgi:uncharacterized protein (DUF885 family)